MNLNITIKILQKKNALGGEKNFVKAGGYIPITELNLPLMREISARFFPVPC